MSIVFVRRFLKKMVETIEFMVSRQFSNVHFSFVILVDHKVFELVWNNNTECIYKFIQSGRIGRSGLRSFKTSVFCRSFFVEGKTTFS